MLRFN